MTTRPDATGKFCLDGTIWNAAAIDMILAFGSATLVVIVVALLVMREVRRRSGVVRLPSLALSQCRHAYLTSAQCMIAP